MAVFLVWHEKKSRANTLTQEELLAETHFQPSRVYFGTIPPPGKHWHYYAATINEAFVSQNDQVHADATSLTLFNGFAFDERRTEPHVLSARELHGWTEGKQHLAGEYAVFQLRPDGTALAYSDFKAMRHLYWIETDDLIAFSTRPSLISLLLGRRNHDLLAQTWNASIGFRLGNRSSLKDIQYIPGDRIGHVTEGRMQLAPCTSPLARLSGPRGLDALPSRRDDLMDAAIAAAAASVRLATRGKDAITLPITGGKDSRLVLALCLAAGLRDRLKLFTMGNADFPDVVVGQMIAEKLAVPHERRPVSPPSSIPFLTAEDYIDRLASFAYQTDGLVGSWDSYVKTATSANSGMNGFMGEILKTNRKADLKGTELAERPIDLIKAPFDPLGLLKPAAKEALFEDARSYFRKHLDIGVPYGDLPDVFYFQNRLPNWLGTTRQVQAFTGSDVLPLGVSAMCELAFSATVEERDIDLIHYRMIQRCAPELIDIPFANATWPAELAPYDKDFIQREPVRLPPGSTTPNYGSWQYSANYNLRLRQRLADLLARTEGAPLWTNLDLPTLLQRLKGGAFTYPQMMSFLGLMPMAMFQSGNITPRKMLTPGSAFDASCVVRDGEDRLWLWDQQTLTPADRAHRRARVARSALTLFSRPEDATPPGPVKGYLDSAQSGESRAVRERDHFVMEAKDLQGDILLSGWARADDFPESSVALEIWNGKTLLKRTLADGTRKDLAQLGYSHGKFGFRVSCDAAAVRASLAKTKHPWLTLTVADGGGALTRGKVHLRG
ncbi:adenine nucleotide alpha hydrolase family protein [Tabrizicola fusiformis]|uniref:hypothetical protein n=1 Tax=Tabrizicola sp. SY72 TaxID=2741673 RepID=UPI0015740415|nr:hypothetical protein [Tabrizicola sp. SY72]NTT85903.1 hypothetical protein [Tabrizicola sp. SY72]